jgi:hypothetical protein
MKPKFVICQELKVYNDFGFKNGSTREFTEQSISLCECKAYEQGRKCKNRGRCIIAREDETWMQVNSKSFGGQNGNMG